MRTGERPAPARGYTYLLLLIAVAVGAALLSAAVPSWQAAAQREREAELLFRGGEFVRALASYRRSTPAGQPAAPQSLEDLLVDTRSTPPRHHLRRVYLDPFTARDDWRLDRDADGGIVALRSSACVPAMRRIGVPLEGGDPKVPKVCDWVFRIAESASPRMGPKPEPALSAE